MGKAEKILIIWAYACGLVAIATFIAVYAIELILKIQGNPLVKDLHWGFFMVGSVTVPFLLLMAVDVARDLKKEIKEVLKNERK